MKKFEEPEMEIVRFETEDILDGSNVDDGMGWA